MTHPKLRTAIYARVSTLDQDPAMQLRGLRAYAGYVQDTCKNRPQEHC
jgi:DNA invertase Pin-like site-specific DNA recombinase